MKLKIVVCLIMFMNVLSVNAQYTKENLTLEPVAAVNKFRYENLQLYPIRANQTFQLQHKDLKKYITLKEALEKKKVLITEEDEGRSGGSVNTLSMKNVSSDTIIILGGEVVQGGKQDRMVSQDVILYPGSGKKDVSVFCVEHGRWQEKKDGTAFNNYFTISSNDIRKAGAVKKDQQEVWNEVSDATSKNGAQSSTGTLTALNESESYKSSLKKYADHFQGLLKESDVIGFVAVSGDAVLGCDMFATHDLLQKHYANLINSYATEAITSGKEVTISYEKVRQYLQTIIADESKQEMEIEKKGTQLKDGKRKIHISTF